jgi:hypothetical protein
VFTRESDTWRYRSKHIDVTLLGDVSDHLNVQIEG